MKFGGEKFERKETWENKIMRICRGLGWSESWCTELVARLKLERRLRDQLENLEKTTSPEREAVALRAYRQWLAEKLKEMRSGGEEGREKAQKFLASEQKTFIYKLARIKHLEEAKSKRKKPSTGDSRENKN